MRCPAPHRRTAAACFQLVQAHYGAAKGKASLGPTYTEQVCKAIADAASFKRWNMRAASIRPQLCQMPTHRGAARPLARFSGTPQHTALLFPRSSDGPARLCCLPTWVPTGWPSPLAQMRRPRRPPSLMTARQYCHYPGTHACVRRGREGCVVWATQQALMPHPTRTLTRVSA